MDFRYGTAFAVPPPEAYERLLLDVMLGDPTLFTRTDEVESAWRFITTILDAWEQPRRPAARHLRRRQLGPARGRRTARRPMGRSGGGCKRRRRKAKARRTSRGSPENSLRGPLRFWPAIRRSAHRAREERVAPRAEANAWWRRSRRRLHQFPWSRGRSCVASP